MQRANKTKTKVELDLSMSEQVRQRQVTLTERKTLVNTKGGVHVRFQVLEISCFFLRLSSLTEMGQRARIFIVSLHMLSPHNAYFLTLYSKI